MYQRTGIHKVEQRSETDARHPTEVWRLLAEQLEPRIEELESTVDSLRSAPHYACLADTVHSCDPVDDLRMKVDAAQWIFRVAKHLDATARDRVIEMVCKSVDDLESTLETELHANAVRIAA